MLAEINVKNFAIIEDLNVTFDKNMTVLTGQTGAGKSTLINKLDDSYDIETGDVSISLGRGRHTTRETSMYEVSSGYIIDTPGFSALDLNNYSKEEIRALK